MTYRVEQTCAVFLAVFAISLTLTARCTAQSFIQPSVKVLIASCPGDRHYHQYVNIQISDEVNAIGGAVRAIPSSPLSPDWGAADTSRLLSASPSAIIVHFSCFENSRTADRQGWNERLRISQRDTNFGRFLASVVRHDVKVLIYSRVFERYPRYLEEVYPELMQRLRGRVLLLCVRSSGRPEIDFDQMRNAVQQLLGFTSPSDSQMLACNR
ncbi:hypothetical protein HL667_01185 [Bradyrhizobium sp. 83012]|uniref:Uncharacterized protein n=1 Tax=Bradyrhizobium aeschynomenes TaxID=2734909 RepID=A0ABX2C8B8_9BRAD|nr:hypothetical protein [Bradyrhizobium aeschynomenes]NPU63607.1 hypothetical protein [Bradyrhizobium aeschynomenes]